MGPTRRILLFALHMLINYFVAAQSLVVDFSTMEDACLEERITLTNTSTQATRFNWDFCEGDLALTPSVITLTEENFDLPVGTSLIQGGGKWYGFVTNIRSNSLLRVDFGESLLNTSPTVVNLGNLGGLINAPQNVKAIESEGQFYVFINNRYGNKLIRISLGSDLESEDVSADILAAGSGFINGGMDLVFDGMQWVVFLTNQNFLTPLTIWFLGFGSGLLIWTWILFS